MCNNSESIQKNADLTENACVQTPWSVTLSLYSRDTYGITYVTDVVPVNPAVQVTLGSTFNEANCLEIKAEYEKHHSFNTDDTPIEYYVVKAVIKNARAGESYSYRCIDREALLLSDEYSFKAYNSKSTDFKALLITDSQTDIEGLEGGKPFSDTVAGFKAMEFNPDFVLHGGDVVEFSRYESYWNNMLGGYNKEFFTSFPIAAISGNHETNYKNGSYETYKHFNYDLIPQDVRDGMYYSFDYSNTRFIMINTCRLNNNSLTDDQYNWLVDLLKNNPQMWTVAVMHNPLYSVGKYGCAEGWCEIALALREQLVDLFAEYGVDMVFQGHDHAYSKSYPIGKNGEIKQDYDFELINGIKYSTDRNGVTYIMSGPAGNQVRYPYAVDEGLYEFADTGHQSSWAQLEVNGNLFTVKIYYSDNGIPVLYKSFGFKK